jgi:hypothetical protein
MNDARSYIVNSFYVSSKDCHPTREAQFRRIRRRGCREKTESDMRGKCAAGLRTDPTPFLEPSIYGNELDDGISSLVA